VPQLVYDGDAETAFQSDRPAKAGDTLTLTFRQPVRLKKVAVLASDVAAVLETSADGKTFTEAAPLKTGAAEAGPQAGTTRSVRLRVTADAEAPLEVREFTLTSDTALPVFRHPLLVCVDTTAVPEMKAWAERAAKIVAAWYPTLSDLLASDGYTPPRRIDLIFQPGNQGIAATMGSRIVCLDGWFKAHPDDYGAVVHESIHVIQSYPKYDPVWLVEGIDDYARFWVYEPQTPLAPVDEAHLHYRSGYTVTGAFLAWLIEHYDKDIVQKLNAACRQSTYTPELFKTATGKDLDTLWAEFRATLKP